VLAVLELGDNVDALFTIRPLVDNITCMSTPPRSVLLNALPTETPAITNTDWPQVLL